MKVKLTVVATILIALLLASACGPGGAATAAPSGSQPPGLFRFGDFVRHTDCF